MLRWAFASHVRSDAWWYRRGRASSVWSTRVRPLRHVSSSKTGVLGTYVDRIAPVAAGRRAEYREIGIRKRGRRVVGVRRIVHSGHQDEITGRGHDCVVDTEGR